MRLLSIVQVRMSSTRLPGKALLPLGNATALDQVIRRAAQFSVQVVVCTSAQPSDDAIEAHCDEQGVVCVRGSLDDVFDRFRQTLLDPRVEQTEWFARVTADCPLVSPRLAEHLMAATEGMDYVAVQYDKTPLGLAIELIRRETYMAIDADSLDDSEREHTTLRLYEEPGRYRCVRLAPPADLQHPEFRLTLDYEEDYKLLATLFEDNDVTATQAVERMRQESALAAINAHCSQKVVRE